MEALFCCTVLSISLPPLLFKHLHLSIFGRIHNACTASLRFNSLQCKHQITLSAGGGGFFNLPVSLSGINYRTGTSIYTKQRMIANSPLTPKGKLQFKKTNRLFFTVALHIRVVVLFLTLAMATQCMAQEVTEPEEEKKKPWISMALS